jgi:hypothetical protein
MDRDQLNDQLDDWLDQALAEYGKVEPPPGIEARVLHGLHGRLKPSPWWGRRLRPIWISSAAAAILFLAVMLFITPGKPPAPDVVTGNDRELLLGVDRLLRRRVPGALEPALVLTKEMIKEQ